MRIAKNFHRVILCGVPRDWKREMTGGAPTMKKIFSNSALVVSIGIFACSLAVGLALVYAMDKFI